MSSVVSAARQLKRGLSHAWLGATSAHQRLECINIGGGPNFAHRGWLNLDGVGGQVNSIRFRLTPDCHLPAPDSSAALIYTSHTLEHLEPATVERVLRESRRVLREEGSLIIKIPDFDRALEAWQTGAAEFFADGRWDFDTVVPTWSHLGVPDSIDSRASMIFVGVWNREHGDPFDQPAPHAPGAYHGPAPVDPHWLRRILATESPSRISAILRERVMERKDDLQFNHQNAWSRAELQALLSALGFRVLTFDRNAIIESWGEIPGIAELAGQSTYCLARRQ